jgi:hypothetical protein
LRAARHQPVHATQGIAPRAQPERQRLKVNDKRGSPIEIAAVVVWRVDDTAKANFDVDNYETTSSAARPQCAIWRHRLPTTMATSSPAGCEPTLLGGSDLFAAAGHGVAQRLAKAGVVVDGAADASPMRLKSRR